MEDTHEMHIVDGMKSDVALGLYLVRGDSVVLLGEIDSAKEAAQNLKEVESKVVLEAEDKAKETGQRTEWDFDKLE